jgi:hypothetical protein
MPVDNPDPEHGKREVTRECITVTVIYFAFLDARYWRNVGERWLGRGGGYFFLSLGLWTATKQIDFRGGKQRF